MPLLEPAIDNRRFDDIVKETKALIPRYAPEWTDFNDNDPGQALVQLFAWMTDMTLFRLAQVPELHYIKFLQLLGVELRPAEPARVEITFPLRDSQTAPTVIVPKGTQVSAAGQPGEPPVIFETDESLIALAARLVAVHVWNGVDFIDRTTQNNAATDGFNPLDDGAEGKALLLGFENPPAVIPQKTFPKTQLNLAIFASAEALRPETLACGMGEAQVFPSAELTWEFWDGAGWRPLTLDKDGTNALTRGGHVLLRTPAGDAMQQGDPVGAGKNLFWIRASVAKAGYERPPKLDAIRTNTIGATQAQTQRFEILGGSNGRPDQSFQLAFRPVLQGTLEIEIQEGAEPEAWTEVEDFFSSKSDDKHFVLNRTTGEVRFGNGENGRIPVANPDNPGANIIALEYRYGGGKNGNVQAGVIKNALSSPAGVDGKITNLRAAIGGRDEEPLEEAKRRAAQQLKNKDRAVTAEDIEALAKQAPGVKRAKALALAHPGFPNLQIAGAVSVIIVPDSDATNPMPSEGLIRSVCAFLEKRRLLTTELFVLPPKYRHVEIRAQVIAQGNADLAEVKQDVEKQLSKYLHPLTGGEDGTGWVFGGDVFYSLVYRQIFSVPGVLRVESLIIARDGVGQPECQDVTISPGELVYSDGHSIEVTYETRE